MKCSIPWWRTKTRATPRIAANSACSFDSLAKESPGPAKLRGERTASGLVSRMMSPGSGGNRRRKGVGDAVSRERRDREGPMTEVPVGPVDRVVGDDRVRKRIGDGACARTVPGVVVDRRERPDRPGGI